MPITLFPPIPPVAAAPVLAPNAAQELNGQLQKIADLMATVLVELRVQSELLSQISEPVQDSPDELRGNFSLSN